MSADFVIRAARKSDMQAVADINNHYISNTARWPCIPEYRPADINKLLFLFLV